MKKLLTALLVSAVGLGTFAAVAQAETLGLPVPPMGSNSMGCGDDGDVIAQATDDPATPYFVPGPGTITQWQMVTPDDASGEPVSFMVLRPVGNAFSVVAADSRTIADPAPNTSSFAPATPIAVSGGETFGLYTDGPDGLDVPCYFRNGATPGGDTLAALAEPDLPAAGQTLLRDGEDSPSGFALNVAVTFQPTSTATTPPTPPPTTHKKKCKKHKKHKRSAQSAKKKHCKKKNKK
jgi:hypothetical protein